MTLYDSQDPKLAYIPRETSLSFAQGPQQVDIFLEHLPKALDYIRKNKIVNIAISSHGPPKTPKLIDFSFLDEFTNLIGFECRMNVSNKTDLAPIYKLKNLKQLAWAGLKIPELDLSCFPQLEYLLYNHSPSTKGWDVLSKLRDLKLLVMNEKDLKFLKNLKSLEKLELLGSSIESMNGIEVLDNLKSVLIKTSNTKLTDISSVAKCKNLKELHIDKIKKLTDFSSLADSASIETLWLRSHIESVEFVSKMKSLRSFFSNDILSNDLSPFLKAKSLKALDIHPEKRSYNYTVDEIKKALGI
jgi:hypothetical protein